MKKIIMMLCMLTLALGVKAQFESEKTYIAAGVNNIDLSYNGAKKFSAGIDVMAGKFFDDNWLAYAKCGYKHEGAAEINDFNAGVGVRYYILQNGLFLGASASYVHGTKSYNDLKPAVELGYCFFISREITIEPKIYYEQSIKRHSDFSTIGLGINFGFYLSDKKLTKSITDAFE